MNIPVVSADLLEQFARTLMTSLDGNRDGQLSTTEFTGEFKGSMQRDG